MNAVPVGILCVRPAQSGPAARYQPSDAESVRGMQAERGSYTLKFSNVLADKILTVPTGGDSNAPSREKRPATTLDLDTPRFRRALTT